MENFNKNWLAILLIVIVFFILGFLTGRVTGDRSEHFQKHLFVNSKNMKFGDGLDEIRVEVDTLNHGKKFEIKVDKKQK